MDQTEIESLMQDLPEELRSEVRDYIEFLKVKYKKKPFSTKGFKFDWEGSLKDLKEKSSSVELQHKASEWR